MSETSCNKADESSRSRSESLDFCSRMAFNSMIDENSFVMIWFFWKNVLYLWPNRAWSRSFYRGAGSFLSSRPHPPVLRKPAFYLVEAYNVILQPLADVCIYFFCHALLYNTLVSCSALRACRLTSSKSQFRSRALQSNPCYSLSAYLLPPFNRSRQTAATAIIATMMIATFICYPQSCLLFLKDVLFPRCRVCTHPTFPQYTCICRLCHEKKKYRYTKY